MGAGAIELSEDAASGRPSGRRLVRHWWFVLARRSVRSSNDAMLVVLDVALVAVAYAAMLLARYDLVVPSDAWSGLWAYLPIAMAVHVTANYFSGLYGPVWEQASIYEAQRLLAAGGAGTIMLTLSLLMLPRLVPLSVAIVGGGIATGLFGLLRFQSRLFAFRRRGQAAGTNVLLVGAGESASSLLREIARAADGSVRPVGLLDDDPRKHGRKLAGLPIFGSVDRLVEVGREQEINQILLAIPNAPSTLVQQVADGAAELGAQLKVLPRVSEFINGHPQLRDVRDLSIDDLLGRQQVTTDMDAVRDLVRGRRVLITGGGGSIGAEIARQVDRLDPGRLVLVDRDETHLFDAAARIGGRCHQVLMDVRDADSVTDLFQRERPEIVFHAAANKHVPILEEYPCEAASTNVFGTANVVAAARDARVERFVFISTDKAVNPSSVMGASKRIGEQLVLTEAPDDSRWCAVRFGNVLGSRGSVVPTFMQQIGRGGPVTVTHRDVTRFFMSIPEAVELVLQAAALAATRQVFMLDMGEPVRIVDLANRMISLVGHRPGVDVKIEVVGLRPGEKLAEELNTDDEHPILTLHPKILELQPRLLDRAYINQSLQQLQHGIDRRDGEQARRTLFDMATHETPVIRLPEFDPITGHLGLATERDRV